MPVWNDNQRDDEGKASAKIRKKRNLKARFLNYIPHDLKKWVLIAGMRLQVMFSEADGQ